MKSGKVKGTSYLKQLVCAIVALLTCLGIYRGWNANTRTCFALTLGAVLFLIWCFYNVVFKGEHQGMVVYILSGASVIMFANKMYDYEKLKTIFPILKDVDALYFVLVSLGGVLSVFILTKIAIYIYDGTKSNKAIDDLNNVKISETVKPSMNEINSETNSNKAWTIIYLFLLIILTGAGCALFGILYRKGIPQRDYDFFEVVILLLKYAGSVVLILLAFVVVIIFLIEMIRLIVSRMRVFFSSLKEETKEDTVPLDALSAVITIVVFYLAYKVTGLTVDTFYDFVNKGEYLALPLIILFVGAAFIVFLRLIHATLLLLVEMKPDSIKEFWKKINDKTNITERVSEILKMIIDIVLDSIITVFKFVKFIPDFFDSIYLLVLEDENEFELEDENENNSERKN